MPPARRPAVDRALAAARGAPPWAWWSLAAAVLFIALLLLFRGPLADALMPKARVQGLLGQADAALAAGRLTAADGSGARELFEAAAAIDPDRPESRAGLTRVARAALAQARERMAMGDEAGARALLTLATELSAPRGELAALNDGLGHLERSRADVDGWLPAAAQARAEGRLHGSDDAALPLYRRVLAQQPANIEALEGREDALADLLQQARTALRGGRLDTADQLMDAARGYDPGHVDLPQTEAAFAQAVEQARRDADRALQRERLVEAEIGYRLLLRTMPGDEAAQRGLQEVARTHAQAVGRHAADFHFDAAEASLVHARRIAPELPEVAAAARHLRSAVQLQARHGPGRGSPGTPARLARLLAEAQAAEARGDLLSPPGDSAFDKLRAARQLAPDDARVRAAGTRLLPAARNCFNAELPRNNLARARGCLDAWVTQGGESGATLQARRRLAERWLAVAEERLAAGHLEGAASAMDAARSVDPQVPGLNGFGERLRVARGAAASG